MTSTPTTQIDPVAYLRDIERAWQARNGVAAAAGYAQDAVLVYGNGRERRGEELRGWPARWFAFAKDLQIKKTLRSFSDNCLAGEWESRYTHPETGQPMLERGAEFFWIDDDGKVTRHHMFEHTWPEGAPGDRWPAV